MNLKTAGAVENLIVNRERHINVAIHRIAEKRAAFFLDADDHQRHAAHLYCLTDRILIGKEFVLNVRSDHADLCRTFDFRVGEKSSGINGFVFDVNHIRRVADNSDRRHFDSVLAYFRSGIHHLIAEDA